METPAQVEVIVVKLEGVFWNPFTWILYRLLSTNLDEFTQVQRLSELAFTYNSAKIQIRYS